MSPSSTRQEFYRVRTLFGMQNDCEETLHWRCYCDGIVEKSACFRIGNYCAGRDTIYSSGQIRSVCFSPLQTTVAKLLSFSRRFCRVSRREEVCRVALAASRPLL